MTKHHRLTRGSGAGGLLLAAIFIGSHPIHVAERRPLGWWPAQGEAQQL